MKTQQLTRSRGFPIFALSIASNRRCTAILGATLVLCVGLSTTKLSAESLVSSSASVPSQELDALVAKFDHPGAPGISVAVYREGLIAYKKSVGIADLEHNVPIASNSVFDIASMSKQFTAMAVVLLDQDGRLSLDDDIRKYLAWLNTGGKVVTIRQLLQHTSGIRDYLDLMMLACKDPDNCVVKQPDVREVIATQRGLNFMPGSEFRYENTSYALMAMLVEKVSGQSLKQFAAQRIFAPLGMNDTQYRDDHTDIIRNRVNGYEPRQGNDWSQVAPIYDEVGDGGVWTTVEDLAKWDANFYHPKVGGELGGESLYAQATLNSGLKMSYALGLFIEKYNGLRMVSHGGVDPGYRAQMIRFPHEKLTVVVLANNPFYDVEGLARHIADVYLPKSSPVAAVRATPAADGADAHFAGKYLDETSGRIREIIAGNEGLLYRSRGGDRPLRAIGNARFEEDDGTVFAFKTTTSANVIMTIESIGAMPVVSRRLPKDPPAWDASEFLGAYESSELRVNWSILRSGSKIVVKRCGKEEELTPLDKDQFSGEVGLIRFNRSSRGKVIGLSVANVRDNGINFSLLPN
jgi:CubicO group peptidase (beta-lactamase class C family)